ncbi:MAG: FAD-monooxygenase [Gammaproteobacteria bacterium]|nr:FAD-monooxygenase [Gammaproteobacteria bacterium]
MEQTPVLIAGGGPVGLMLALELDYHGIDAVLVERNPTTTRHPKMDITNGRSMELFRRLGVIDALRAEAVPEDHPVSVIWADNLAGRELTRFDYPSVNEMRRILREKNDGTMAAEPSMRISQVQLEPVLKGVLENGSQHVSVRFGWGLETFIQDDDGVTATIRHTGTGKAERIRARYLAGCDGAGSVTRGTLGIPVNTITPADYLAAGDDHHNYLDTARGEPPEDAERVRSMFMIHWTSPELDLFERFGKAWHIQSPMGWSIISQNDRDTWTVHIPVPAIRDPEDRDPKEILFEFLGCEFECEVQVANPWGPRLGLADSYGAGRVWLAGDSAHQFIPTGGYGMNSGLCDAMGLAWVLAANVRGWGTPALFEAYEIERRHVAARARIGSARHAAVRYRIAEQYDPLLHEDSDAGAAKRVEVGAFIKDAGNLENEAWGLEWGYRYADSPVVCHERGEAPDYEWERYVPGTWPGARAPNVFLPDGRPIFDTLGRAFTLLSFGGGPCLPIEEASRKVGLPLSVVHIEDPHAASLYERRLVLVRPDQHVAWRGNADPTPAEATLIVNRVRGAHGETS